MTDGIILIDKPSGMTSFGVVARVRRVLSKASGKKIKVGHTGTLDPFATGLMILVIGNECKNAQHYSKLDKTYQATICLGKISSTGDSEGDIRNISESVPSIDEINTVLERFKGEIEQKPPIFSAIKINGQRAYHLARQGQMIDMPIRTVNIYYLDLIKYEYPYLIIRTKVSSGTYIRTLASDIGNVLNTGAYCTQLRRLEIADWKVEQAKTLADMSIDS